MAQPGVQTVFLKTSAKSILDYFVKYLACPFVPCRSELARHYRNGKDSFLGGISGASN